MDTASPYNRARAVAEALRAWAPLVASGYEVPAAGQPMSEAAQLLEAAPRIKPLDWADESAADFTLSRADTPVGRFVYGTDITGQPYHQDPHGEEDHLTEDAARTAAETAYMGLVREKVRPLLEGEIADPRPCSRRAG